MKKSIHIILLVTGVLFLSCSDNRNIETAGNSKTVPVIKLFTDSARVSKEYVGSVHAIKNIDIYARVKGYLEEVYVDEGQYVKEGQPLFKINDDEYKSELSKVKASLSYSIAEAKEMELEVERLRQLVEKKVISKTELEVAQARLAAARSKVEEAQNSVHYATLRLNLTKINAPFDGIIDRIPYKLGSLIDEGTKLTTLSDINEVFVYFDVSESEYLRYIKTSHAPQKDKVELILADGTRFPEQGRVETMEGQFNEKTGSIAFRAGFPNPQKILKHGSTGTIRLTTTLDKALLIPHKACFELQDKNFVFIVNKDNKVKMRSFTPKTRVPGAYVVESGLSHGDMVVYEGIQNLRDGMTIKPRYINIPSLNYQQSR